jgi:hypothetical protein
MADSLSGRQLGNYRLERLIGRGGMAEVYYGWDEALQRPVAAKLLDSRFRANQTYARRFVQEARAIATWRHENIVQVYYAGVEDELYYFAMEYIEGQDLSRLMAGYAESGRKVPHDEVLKIGRAVAAALDYAHQRQVVHRDVKPSNIMIAANGRIVLTDFGLALDAHTGSIGDTFGSPHYIAPEQARNSSQAIPQSDLYALGVILYELLTGAVPFDDPSATSLALQHLLTPPPPPRSLNPDLNEATEAVLLRALSKQPPARYATGAALMDALTGALAGAAPAQPEAPGVLRRAKAPLLWLSLGGCLLSLFFLILMGTLWLVWPGAESEVIAGAPPTLSVTAVAGDDAPIPTPLSERATEAAAATAPAATPLTDVTAVAADLSPPPADPPSPPTAVSAPTNLPAATIAYPNGRRVLLLYDEHSFYIWNASADRIRISAIGFEALDQNGLPAGYWFDGTHWSQFYSLVAVNGCNRIEALRAPAYLRPSRCREYNATVTPPPDSEMIFWMRRPGVSQFRVLWEGREIARCELDVELCEVFLP